MRCQRAMVKETGLSHRTKVQKLEEFFLGGEKKCFLWDNDMV